MKLPPSALVSLILLPLADAVMSVIDKLLMSVISCVSVVPVDVTVFVFIFPSD